jgi:hypothetical protein
LSVQTRPHLPIWNKTKRIFGELVVVYWTTWTPCK